MSRFFVELSYKGTNFNGWQIQKNTPQTVQQVLEECFEKIFREKISITGCGRTDTGVHAKNYVAHFDCEQILSIEKIENYIYRLNQVLPNDISIQKIYKVKEDAHARFNALSRTYKYYLIREKNPFKTETTFLNFGNLNFELMNEAAKILFKQQDFTSFSKHHTQTYTNNCNITFAKWININETEWVFKIKANRFLRGMVRAIVGTLLLVGQEKITSEEFEKIIIAKDRKLAGGNVPAHALFLCEIKYSKKILSE